VQYFGTNLGSDPHNLTVNSVSGGGGPYWDIDNIVVYDTSGNISTASSADDSLEKCVSAIPPNWEFELTFH
jgi:hypothetical protein